jgi:hypothetical protein
MEILGNLPPVVVLVLALLLAIWLVLLLLVPFMIESIRGSTRRAHFELGELNKKVDKLITLLSERSESAPVRMIEPREPRGATRPERARKEPTISG